MKVEVVYALADAADAVTVTIAPGATLAEAVSASGIRERHPEIGTAPLRLGVFGEARAPDSPAADGDRIEIYRLLLADPKETRRRRARRAKGIKR